jgi:hypothetical protein
MAGILIQDIKRRLFKLGTVVELDSLSWYQVRGSRDWWQIMFSKSDLDNSLRRLGVSLRETQLGMMQLYVSSFCISIF